MKPQLLLSMKSYKKTDLLNDLMAGLLVAIIALPLSIALGLDSVDKNVSPNGIQYGLITAIVAGFLISALGGSKHQIGGPTAAFAVILFGYFSTIGILGLALAGIMAGVILIAMGLLKVGNVMKFFPYPIIIGFTTGIGVTLLIGQIKNFCGFDGGSSTEATYKIISYIENIHTFDLATFCVGLVGLLCVILLPKLSKKIPAAFIALIACTGATLLLNGLAGTSIDTIGSAYGKVQAGFFPVDFSGIADVNFGQLIVPALVIAFLCAIESLLSATVAAAMAGTNFDANQELIGQGVANIGSSLLGGLPATGAIARTAANIENGAKSPLAGVFHAVFLLIMYFALMEVLQYVPLAVFSAILISVAINMSRFPLFAKLAKFGVRDVIILITTFVLTVIFDLTYGVLGGIAVTFIVNVQNIKKGVRIERVNVAEDCPVETKNVGRKNTVLTVSGTLFFLNTNKLTSAIEKEFETSDCVTVDLSNTERVDETALEKLHTLDKKYTAQGKTVDFVEMNERIAVRFEKFYKIV